MKSSKREARTSNNASVSLVKQDFRKGYEIPLLPHQRYGILSKVLWPSKNHIIRIVPGFDPSTGEIFKQNINCNSFALDNDYTEYLSDSFMQATVVSRFGSINNPFIIDYEPGSPDEQKYAGETVIRSFIRSIMYAVSGKSKRKLKATNEWAQWCNIGANNKLSFDKASLLMQSLVFHVNGRNNYDIDSEQDMVDADGDILPLMAVVVIDNKLSIANLCTALVEPTSPGVPLDAATNNKYGPMAELDGNKLFLNTYTDPASKRAALRPSVQAPGQGWTPTPFPLTEEAVKMLWHPWESLLSYMTAEEQLRLCAEEFGKDTVNYVIGTDPMMESLTIPDDIANYGLGRYSTTTQVPVTQKPQGLGAKPPIGGMPSAQKPSGLKLAPTATVDASSLAEQVNKLRNAAAGHTSQMEDSSALAASLLDDDDQLEGLGG